MSRSRRCTRSLPTVLPASLGADARSERLADKFVAWTRGYREGVALTHGYGHPRLQKSGRVAGAGLRRAARRARPPRRARKAAGGRRSISRRAARLLDAAFTQAGVRGLPPRPTGQHVVADLMAFYFRSSEANDDCYSALINREVCRPIAITTRKPAPLSRERRSTAELAEIAEHKILLSAASALRSRDG